MRLRERDWWALHEALAWLMQNVQTDSELQSSLSWNEADRELRGAGADGVVRMRGACWERKGINPTWMLVRDVGPIPAEAMEALEPFAWRDGTLALVDETMAAEMRRVGLMLGDLMPLTVWASITVSAQDLQRSYGASTEVARIESRVTKRKPGPADKGAAIVAAYRALYPDGRPLQVPKSTRDDRLRQYLKEELGFLEVFHDTTLRKHLRDIDP
jgi:hypothetical protein